MSDRSTDSSLPTARKRVPLGRAIGVLRKRLTLYRGLAAAAVAAALLLGGLLVLDTPSDEEVDLGTGRAGVAIAERPTPMSADQIEAEDEVDENGRHLGNGRASFYGEELAGNPTATGEPFDPAKLTAAHRTLPLGSRVRVTNIRSGKSVVVRINDRGPFHGERVIDLSKAAARTIGMLRQGTARVRLELIEH